MSEPVALIWYFWLSQTVLLSWLCVRQQHCYKSPSLGLLRCQRCGASPFPRAPLPRGTRALAARRPRSCRHPGCHGRSGTLGEGCRSREHISGQPVGGLPGAAGAVRGCAGRGTARPLDAARPRPAAAAVPLPGQGQAERGGGDRSRRGVIARGPSCLSGKP